MNHVSDEELVLFFYDEPDADRQQREHLRGCAECEARFQSLRATLELAGTWTGPEPDAGFERGVWNQIVPKLEPKVRTKWNPGWRWILAAAMLLAAVFIAGRISTTHPPDLVTAGLSAQARQRILAISLADHLERTALLLMDVSNAAESLPEGETERARDLVSENRLIRQALDGRRNPRDLAVLTELECFLLEIANAPGKISAADLREWQQRITSSSLLFKVRVTQQNLTVEVQQL